MQGCTCVFLQLLLRWFRKRVSMEFDALKKGLALIFILDQLFAEVGAQSDGSFAGVVDNLETFDDVPNFLVGIVFRPFFHWFLEESWSNLDQLWEEKYDEITRSICFNQKIKTEQKKTKKRATNFNLP